MGSYDYKPLESVSRTNASHGVPTVLKIFYALIFFIVLFMYKYQRGCNNHSSEYKLEHGEYLVSLGLEPIGVVIADQTTESKSIFIRNDSTTTNISNNIVNKLHNYYVYTTHCKMRSIDPFTAAAKKVFHPNKPMNCSDGPPLVRVLYDTNARHYMLHIELEAVAVRFPNSSENFSCCYREIIRSGSGGSADTKFTLLDCAKFHQDFIVPSHIQFTIINCMVNSSTKVVYEDAFSFVQRQINHTNTRIEPKIQQRKPNVLMIGIDTLSRMNFRRNMPLTFAYLQKENWYELMGYNKMGDNTFPNLMALLTGMNLEHAYSTCKPKSPGGLDKCHFIWNDYQNAGYYTAYAEDRVGISTFNYMKKGFLQQPTDFYLRPMMMAILEHMHITKHGSLEQCIGRKHSGEHIYDAAMEVARRISDEPFFGLFWTNSFSHDYFDESSSMDVRMVEYFKSLKESGTMEESIVIFFSDHGCRWGALLNLPDAFYEERLPMFFIHLPNWFHNNYPELVEALRINQNRLTSPYDIYLTLQHIIQIFDENVTMPACQDCNKAQSILLEVPFNRTCEDVGINEHWCTCIPYDPISTDNIIVKNITTYTVDRINEFIALKNLTSSCESLSVKKIEKSELRFEEEPNPTWSTYKIKFKTKPGNALLQTTVDYNKINNTIKVDINNISRLNSYAKESGCISDKEAKLYCMCKNEK